MLSKLTNKIATSVSRNTFTNPIAWKASKTESPRPLPDRNRDHVPNPSAQQIKEQNLVPPHLMDMHSIKHYYSNRGTTLHYERIVNIIYCSSREFAVAEKPDEQTKRRMMMRRASLEDRATSSLNYSDPGAIYFALSYRQLPGDTDSRMTEEQYEMAVHIARSVAKYYGYPRYALWTDGIASSGMFHYEVWRHKGLYPYAVLPVITLDQYDTPEYDLKRGWLAVEHSLATFAMGIFCLSGGASLWPGQRRANSILTPGASISRIDGDGMSIDGALERLAIRINLGLLRSVEFSFDADREDMTNWAVAAISARSVEARQRLLLSSSDFTNYLQLRAIIDYRRLRVTNRIFGRVGAYGREYGSEKRANLPWFVHDATTSPWNGLLEFCGALLERSTAGLKDRRRDNEATVFRNEEHGVYAIVRNKRIHGHLGCCIVQLEKVDSSGGGRVVRHRRVDPYEANDLLSSIDSETSSTRGTDLMFVSTFAGLGFRGWLHLSDIPHVQWT